MKKLAFILILLLAIVLPIVSYAEVQVIRIGGSGQDFDADDDTYIDDAYLDLAHDNTGVLYSDGAGDVSVMTEGQLPDGTVVGADIKDDTIDSPDYAADSIDNEHINWADIDNLDNEGLSLFLKLKKTTAEPTDEAVFNIYRASDPWDPGGLGLGDTNDYLVMCTATGDPGTYVNLLDDTGKWYVNTIQAAMKVGTDANGEVLTASEMNMIWEATGAGDFDIPADQCDTATGKWLTLISTAAHSNSIDFVDAADDFYLSDGSLVDGAANELVLGGAAGNMVTIVCTAANKWRITGEIGTCTSKADD
jgi:hypothetical protein